MNNINNFKGILEKKNIFIRRKNKHYLKLEPFEPFQVNNVFLKNIDNDPVLILESGQGVFEYWPEQDLVIPPWQRHWFQLKDSFLLKLKNGLLKNIINKATDKAGNINKLCKALGMTHPALYNLKKDKIAMVSVKKLKRLLNYLSIHYTEFNDKIDYTKKGLKISLNKPRFPIDLNSKYGAFILGAIVSDGCIYVDKKARGVIRTKYSTSEEESTKYFFQCLKNIYGDLHIMEETARNCKTIRLGCSIVGESLLKVGAILGHKAKANEGVPWLIKAGSKELKKHYLSAAFSDEASVYIGKKPTSSYIIISRYKHLSNLSREQIAELSNLKKYMAFKKFSTGHINGTIPIKKTLGLIRDDNLITQICSAPKLLEEEAKLLGEFGIEHRLWARSLNKTSLGNYSVCYDLFVNKNRSIKKFYKEIGFSLTYKQEKLIKVLKNLETKNGIKVL